MANSFNYTQSCGGCSFISKVGEWTGGFGETMFTIVSSWTGPMSLAIATLWIVWVLLNKKIDSGYISGGQIARTILIFAIVTIAMSTYTYWKTYVVDTSQAATTGFAMQVMGTMGVQSQEHGVLGLLDTLERNYLLPLDAMWTALEAWQKNLGYIDSVGVGFTYSLGLVILNALAIIVVVAATVVIMDYTILWEIITGFAPLLMWAVIYKSTRGSAISAFKILMASSVALAIIGVIAAIGTYAAQEVMLDWGLQYNIDDKGNVVPVYQPIALSNFVWSPAYMATVMIYLLVIFYTYKLVRVAGEIIGSSSESGMVTLVGGLGRAASIGAANQIASALGSAAKKSYGAGTGAASGGYKLVKKVFTRDKG